MNNDKARTGLNWWQLRKIRTRILSLQKFLCFYCEKDLLFANRVELHHINGNPYDNRRVNLCVVCPSCHKAVHFESERGTLENNKI